jgi:hypothetical protein
LMEIAKLVLDGLLPVQGRDPAVDGDALHAGTISWIAELAIERSPGNPAISSRNAAGDAGNNAGRVPARLRSLVKGRP